MNYTNCSTRNFLLIDKENDCTDKMLKFAVKQAEKGYKILILTCSDNIRIVFKQEEMKSYLSWIFIMYFENIDKLIAKLLNLHDWVILPNIIILDLNSLFMENNVEPVSRALILPTKKDVCLLVSSLLNYIHLLNNCESSTTFSVALANKNILPEAYAKTLIDLYFYKSKFSNFIDLINNLPII